MMRRTAFKPSKAVMKSTGFLRTRVKEAGAVVKVKRAMKTRGPKMTPIRKAARGQDCTLQIFDVCNCNPETTVLCHDNRMSSGKGMGLKAPDSAAVFGCSSCHDVLDGRAPRPAWLTLEALYVKFDRARDRTHEVLRKKGLMPDVTEVRQGATSSECESLDVAIHEKLKGIS